MKKVYGIKEAFLWSLLEIILLILAFSKFDNWIMNFLQFDKKYEISISILYLSILFFGFFYMRKRMIFVKDEAYIKLRPLSQTVNRILSLIAFVLAVIYLRELVLTGDAHTYLMPLALICVNTSILSFVIVGEKTIVLQNKVIEINQIDSYEIRDDVFGFKLNLFVLGKTVVVDCDSKKIREEIIKVIDDQK